jgi:hypothetical protein
MSLWLEMVKTADCTPRDSEFRTRFTLLRNNNKLARN